MPRIFTEKRVIMLSSVLHCKHAIRGKIQIKEFELIYEGKEREEDVPTHS